MTDAPALARGRRWGSGARIREAWPDLGGEVVAFAVAACLVGLLGADEGGYFPGAWTVATPIVSVVVIAVVALARELRLSRAAVTTVAGMAALGLWTALSALWSGDGTATAHDVRRVLLYVAGTAALVLVARSGRGAAVALGVLAAVAAIDSFSIASRLYPQVFGTFDTHVAFGRLYQPIGYWNGLGAFSALGIVLAIGFAARGGMALRMLAAASLVVTAPALYLTFSRGAVIALAVGLLTLLALDGRRLQLIAAGGAGSIGAVAAVATVHGHTALTNYYRHLNVQANQGAAVAATLVSLVPLAMGASALASGLESRFTVSDRARKTAAVCLIVAALAAAGLGIQRFGSPVGAVRDAVSTLNKPAPTFPKGDLNHRLLSLSTNGRTLFWKAAWHDFLAHPAIGSGGGTYQRYWNAHRPVKIHVRNAHSVFLETMAELGAIGLLILVVALGAPLRAGLAARRRPLGATLVAAYVAYLVQAAGDWTWQLPAVTFAALGCGAAMTGLDRDEAGIRLPERARTGAIVLAAVVAVAAIAGGGR